MYDRERHAIRRDARGFRAAAGIPHPALVATESNGSPVGSPTLMPSLVTSAVPAGSNVDTQWVRVSHEHPGETTVRGGTVMHRSSRDARQAGRTASVGMVLVLTGSLLTACGTVSPVATQSPAAASPSGTSSPASAARPTEVPSVPASPRSAQGSAAPAAGRWVDAGVVVDPTTPEFGAIWPHLAALGDGGAIAIGSDNRCAPGGPVFGDGRSAHLFDATSGAWAPTGSLNKDRGAFVMLTLPDDRVLVTGGTNRGDAGPSFSSTKLWDAADGTWRDGGGLNHARTDGFGVLLADGRVLVGGGTFYDGVNVARALNSAEVYDRTSDSWSDVAPMPVALGFATGVRLADGRVLVIGSTDATSFTPGYDPVALVYDPRAASWMRLESPGQRWTAELVALPDGGALVLMGAALRFDGASGGWTQIAADRDFVEAQAVLLPSGQVLVAGGQAPNGPDDASWPALDRVDLWDPATGAWTSAPPMPAPRQDGEMVVLADGSVLYAAGANAANPNDAPSCPSSVATAVRYLPGG
jgi:hypothetical protein